MMTCETLAQVACPIIDAPDPEDLLRSYETYLYASGFTHGQQKVHLGAKTFLQRFPQLVEWVEVPLQERLSWHRSIRSFVNYLIMSHALLAPMDWLLATRPKLGPTGQRLLERESYQRFKSTGRQLKYAESVLNRTFNTLMYVQAFTGKAYEELTESDLQAFETALRAWAQTVEHFNLPGWLRALFCLHMVLFHDGVLPAGPARGGSRKPRTREEMWSTVPNPAIRQTAWHYLDQLALIRRPGTIKNHEGALRDFFTWLAQTYPEVDTVAAITRLHIEEYKTHLRTSRNPSGKLYHIHTYQFRLGVLRIFFLQIAAWGWDEAPQKMLIFAGDFPVRDEPLPRFLDDAQAAALLRAVRASTDLFTRVCVETLLRTGLRKGEFIDLTVDSVVKIGGAFWLRVPLGKLHNDRYVPLHADVKCLLDEWMNYRGALDWTSYLFVAYGRRISVSRVDEVVKRAAKAAGIKDPVSPHRLRHTLATQAINNGMSLESIAALLGHRSLSMTLVYAKIANRVVQEEYAAVSEQLDRLYAPSTLELPGQVEGPEMQRLRREMAWRMLGNGYCTRDAKLACEFETICESCPCFITTPEFLPTLQKQLTDAEQKGQVGRAKVYAQLIESIAA